MRTLSGRSVMPRMIATSDAPSPGRADPRDAQRAQVGARPVGASDDLPIGEEDAAYRGLLPAPEARFLMPLGFAVVAHWTLLAVAFADGLPVGGQIRLSGSPAPGGP